MVVALRTDALNQALINALIKDGFTGYFFGPAALPVTKLFFYEWPDGVVDVIALPLQGRAAAARLASSDDPLSLPDTAVWADTGDPEMTMWRALKLPAPGHPDAPNAQVRTPAELQVPPEQRAAMTMHSPEPLDATARVDRLRRPRTGASREFFENLFNDVDTGAAIGAAANFTEDGTFKFAEFPKVRGRTAIMSFVLDMHSKWFTEVWHCLRDFQESRRTRRAFTSGTVTFTLRDNREIARDFQTQTHFTPEGDVSQHQVTLDTTGLFPAHA